MKKNYLIIIIILFITYSCGSDPQIEEEVVIEPPVIEKVIVSSFSKAYAYMGDEVSIVGENFNDDKSKVEIFLEDKKIEIISINKNKIDIKIPEGIITNKLLNLKIVIPNSNITYSNSFKKIAIIDNTKNKWITINHDYSSINGIRNFNAIGKEEIYFSLQETTEPGKIGLFKVKKSFNGGVNISVLNQDYNFTENSGSFFLSSNGNEYSFRAGHLYRKNKEEESKLLYNFSQNGSFPLDFYVSKDEKNIITATSEGQIYSSTDNGNTFNKVYENANSRYQFKTFSAVSPNHIWLAGFTSPETPPYNPAKMLYLKQDGKWYEKSLHIEIKDGNYEYINQIHFIDEVTGFAIARISNYLTKDEKYVIIKSDTKGDTWNIVYTQKSKIENFTFKDKNIGWFISGKEIFKTIDGGATWVLDYTNDTDCKGILYNDNTLWVIANEKLLKYYF